MRLFAICLLTTAAVLSAAETGAAPAGTGAAAASEAPPELWKSIRKRANGGASVVLRPIESKIKDTGLTVRVTLALEVPSEAVLDELKASQQAVRKVLVEKLREKREAELDTADRRELLKQQLLESLNGILKKGRVSALFFSTFDIQ